MTYPDIGEFETELPLVLNPMPNGGWVVSQDVREIGVMGKDLGAYSNAEDMLKVLRGALGKGETE